MSEVKTIVKMSDTSEIFLRSELYTVGCLELIVLQSQR